MNKKEYFNIIKNEIKINEELLKNTNNLIEFYENIEDEKKLNELIKNKKLYETRINMLKDIEQLPLYNSIINMDSNELNKYKEKLLSDQNNELELIENRLKDIEQDIIDSNNDIDNKYILYKKTNDEVYVDEAKVILNHIKNLKNEIKTLIENKKSIETKVNKISSLNEVELRNSLKDELGINSFDIEILNMYKPNRIDKLVVPMCNNLEILDNIIDEMNTYIKLDKEKIYETIILPRILNEYTFDKLYNSSIDWITVLINDQLNDLNLEMNDIEDFDIIKNNVKEGINLVTKDKEELEKYNNILYEFSNNRLFNDLNILKELSQNILRENYGDKVISDYFLEIDNFNKEYNTLSNKFQTQKVKYKCELLKLEKQVKVKMILDLLWKYLTNDIEHLLERIKYDYGFYFNLDTMDIYSNDKIIIESDNYNTVNLYNTKVLVKETLNKYNNLITELEKLEEINEEKKINFIKKSENKNIKLNNIKNNINSLYSKVSNISINTEDYEKIINVFNNNTIIDSIVKVESEELINKVNKYSIIDENIINELTTNEEEINEESIIGDNKENKEEKIKNKIKEEDLIKIKEIIKKLGLTNEQIRSLIEKIIKDDLLIDNILKLDKKGTLNKEQIKNIINEIKIDENTDFIVLISELYEKLEIDEEMLKELVNEILKDRSLIIDVLKQNKKILFNLVKSDVMKKILKK